MTELSLRIQRSLMSRITSLREWLRDKHNMTAVSLVLVMFVLHLVALFQVDDYIYDEDAYVGEALHVLHGTDVDWFWYYNLMGKFGSGTGEYQKGDIDFDDPEEGRERREEAEDLYFEVAYKQHMPLSRMFIALGIALFGDNIFGWRIMPVLFGVVSILLFYLICQRLSNMKWLPLIATFIFAFENLCFVISGVAMLDVFAVTLLLASFLFYLRNRYVSAGVLLALATLCKANAVFGGLVIIFHWLLTRRHPLRDMMNFGIAAPLAFFILLPLVDYIGVERVINPWDRITFYLDIHADPFLAQAPEQFRKVIYYLYPWQWLVSRQSVVMDHDPAYQFNTSWTLWVAAIPAMAYMLYESVRNRWNPLTTFVLLWFVCSYFPWFAVYWLADRVSYTYYFYPTTVGICLAAGYAICRLLTFASARSHPAARWAMRIPAMSWLVAHFVVFWVMAPIF